MLKSAILANCLSKSLFIHAVRALPFLFILVVSWLQVMHLFSTKTTDVFLFHTNIYFLLSPRTNVMDTHKRHLNEELLMSTNNICFHGEKRKVFMQIHL